jgi:hypothetical protein
MRKEMLGVEFRYHKVAKSEYGSEYETKKITIGIYDSLEEAIEEGNKTLDKLSNKFKFRGDRFGKTNGILGGPNRLVTDLYTNDGIEVFVFIVQLKFDDVEEALAEAFKSEAEYRKTYQIV